MFCYKCGHKNPDDAVFCMKCGVKVEPEIQNPAPGQESKTNNKPVFTAILIILGIILIGPLMMFFAFKFPMGIGFIWIIGMLIAGIKIKVKAKFWWVTASVLVFLAFMGTTLDSAGNPVTNYLLKSIYCESEDTLKIERNIYHSGPGETSISYRKYCIKPNGAELKLSGWRNFSVNLIFYFGIALLMFLVNRFICYLKFSRETINLSSEQQLK